MDGSTPEAWITVLLNAPLLWVGSVIKSSRSDTALNPLGHFMETGALSIGQVSDFCKL